MQNFEMQNQLNNLTEEEQLELFQVEELESRLEMAAAWGNGSCPTDNSCNPPKDTSTTTN
ncbi:MAG: hypothetical protein J0L99_06195 [Chitinophagales bacterium]|nr:hypothetical protein [Chitinophagales bacterium]